MGSLQHNSTIAQCLALALSAPRRQILCIVYTMCTGYYHFYVTELHGVECAHVKSIYGGYLCLIYNHTNDHIIMHLIMQYLLDSGSFDSLMLSNSINLMCCCYSLWKCIIFLFLFCISVVRPHGRACFWFSEHKPALCYNVSIIICTLLFHFSIFTFSISSLIILCEK